MAYSSDSSNISLTLLIHKKSQRVIFAAANQESVDFLCQGLIANQGIPKVEKLKKLAAKGDGFMKGMMAYMIMDDFEVKPWSLESGLNMVDEYQMDDFEEKVVSLGMTECSKLVTALKGSENVLTTVFLA